MTTPHLSRRNFLARSGIAVAAIAFGAGFVAACGDDDEDTSATLSDTTSTTEARSTTTVEPVELRAMMPFPLNLQFIADVAAESGGFMDEAGVDLNLEFARGQGQAIQALATGQANIIRSSPLSVIQAVTDQGAPFLIVGMLNQTVLYRLVSTDDRPVNSIEELEGKTVGFPTLGGQAEEVFNILARNAGIDPTSVNRVAAGSDAAGLALVEEGKVDALFAITEAAAILEQTNPKAHVVEFEDPNPLLGNALVTTKQFAEENPEAITRYLRGLHEAMVVVNDEEDRQDLLTKVREDWELPLLDDPQKREAAIDAISDLWYAAGEDNLLRNVPERWEEGLDNFQDLGLVKDGVEASQFYTNEFVEKALEG